MRPFAQVVLVLLIELLASICPVEGTVAAVNVSFMFPTALSDLGFSYQYNIARIKALKLIQQEYPSVVIRHVVDTGVAAMTSSDATALIEKRLTIDNCSVIVGVSSDVFAKISNLTAFMNKYTMVRFIDMNLGKLLSGSNGGNYAAMGIYSQAGMFLAGAAAATVCHDAVGMILPVGLRSAANAFLKGLLFGQQYRADYNASRYANTSMCKLITIIQNSFSYPVGEVEISNLFVQRGANVVLIWADTRVAALQLSKTNPEVFTIAWATDGALVVGDTVLTSVVVDATQVFYQVMRDYLDNVPLANTNYLIRVASQDVGVKLGSISAKSPRSTTQAAAAAKVFALNNPLLCGPLIDQAGAVQLATGCLTLPQMQFNMPYFLQGIESLPYFVRDNVCGPGTYVIRNLSTFLPSCEPCGVGTVAPDNGTISCAPCPAGFQSNRDRTLCVVIPAAAAQTSAAVIAAPTVIGGTLLVVVVFAFFAVAFRKGSVFWMFQSQHEPLVHELVKAPVGPRIAIAMLAIDPFRSDLRWRRNMALVGEVYEVLDRIVTATCLRYQVYVTINVGDMHVMVQDDPEVLMKCLACIEHDFRVTVEKTTQFTKYSLALRILLHGCCPTIIPPKQAKLDDVPLEINLDRTQFVGPDVRVMKAIWSAPEVIQSEPFFVSQAATMWILERLRNGRPNETRTQVPPPLASIKVVGDASNPIQSVFRMSDIFGVIVDFPSQAQEDDNGKERATEGAPFTVILPFVQIPAESQSNQIKQSDDNEENVGADIDAAMKNRQPATRGRRSREMIPSPSSSRTSCDSGGGRGGESPKAQIDGVTSRTIGEAMLSSAASTSILTQAEFYLIVKICASLVGKFVHLLEPTHMLDILLFGCSRLHLDVFPGVVIPSVSMIYTAEEQQREAQPRVPSCSGFSKRVVLQRAAVSALSESTNDSQQGNTDEANITRKVVRSALKLLSSQVVVTMDEMQLAGFVRGE